MLSFPLVPNLAAHQKYLESFQNYQCTADPKPKTIRYLRVGTNNQFLKNSSPGDSNVQGYRIHLILMRITVFVWRSDK